MPFERGEYTIVTLKYYKTEMGVPGFAPEKHLQSLRANITLPEVSSVLLFLESFCFSFLDVGVVCFK